MTKYEVIWRSTYTNGIIIVESGYTEKRAQMIAESNTDDSVWCEIRPENY